VDPRAVQGAQTRQGPGSGARLRDRRAQDPTGPPSSSPWRRRASPSSRRDRGLPEMPRRSMPEPYRGYHRPPAHQGGSTAPSEESQAPMKEYTVGLTTWTWYPAACRTGVSYTPQAWRGSGGSRWRRTARGSRVPGDRLQVPAHGLLRLGLEGQAERLRPGEGRRPDPDGVARRSLLPRSVHGCDHVVALSGHRRGGWVRERDDGGIPRGGAPQGE